MIPSCFSLELESPTFIQFQPGLFSSHEAAYPHVCCLWKNSLELLSDVDVAGKVSDEILNLVRLTSFGRLHNLVTSAVRTVQ